MSSESSGVQILRHGRRSRTGLQMQMFTVVDVDCDFLWCRTWDGENVGDEDILVALPWMLRWTPFDGETRDGITYEYTSYVERTADDGDATEDQVIVPDYVTGDVIFAAKGIVGGTYATDENGDEVEWQDLNVDGRAWAKEA
jgi:hypothetical protein